MSIREDDILVENLNNSIEEKVGNDVVLCERCGERVEYSNDFDRSRKYCSERCASESKKENDRIKAKARYYSRKANNL